MNINTLAFISTHIINEAVISEYKKLAASDNIDALLIIDNTNLKIQHNSRIEEQVFFNEKVKCFLMDSALNTELNLTNWYEFGQEVHFPKSMWYNSDYRFYYVRKYFPDY